MNTPYRRCDTCGYPHFFPVSTYVNWIRLFGKHHVFREGKKAGRPTQASLQTARWQAIVDKHTT